MLKHTAWSESHKSPHKVVNMKLVSMCSVYLPTHQQKHNDEHAKQTKH